MHPLRQFIAAICCFSLFAQSPQQPAQAPASTTPTFSTTTNLVVLNVTVRDKSGKLVDNLKKEDFTVFEDEKPQSVAVFEMERLSSDVLPPRTSRRTSHELTNCPISTRELRSNS